MSAPLATVTFTATPGIVIPARTSVEVSSSQGYPFHPHYGCDLRHLVQTTRLVTAEEATVQADGTVTVDLVDPFPWEVRRIIHAILRKNS